MGCSRRAFVGGAVAVAGMMASSALVACGGEQADDASSQPSVPVVTEEAAPDPIETALAGMSREQKVAQLLATTPEGLLGAVEAEASVSDSYGANGVIAVGDDLKQAIQTYPVGGFCLFGANIAGKDQAPELVAGLVEASRASGAGIPALVSIDEEGGPLVARIANSGYFDVKRYPNMAEVGAAGDTDTAHEIGQTIGGYLHDLGITVDLAPVADVLTNPSNTVIGQRSFGSDPQLVASMVKAEVEGFCDSGTLCCAKHFPGHGDTYADSHAGAAVTTRTREQMDSCEFLPFEAAIEAGAPMIMVGHITTPNVTGDDLPATLSPAIIDGILRQDLGFDGVVVSDAMSMAAIGNDYTSGQAAVKFVQAGGDLVLKPNSLSAAYEGLLDALDDGTLTEERIDKSVRRILRAKQACGLLAT